MPFVIQTAQSIVVSYNELNNSLLNLAATHPNG